MRGIELPVNAIIIIVLAVIALIAIIAFFYPGFFTSEETVSKRTALNRACMRLMDYNCEKYTTSIQTVDFDADMDGIVGELARNGDNLFILCRDHYQIDCTNQIEGDVNGDCIVDFIDRQGIIDHWWPGPPPGPLGYDPDYDIDSDGRIDIFDLEFVNDNWGNIEPEAEKACKKLCKCPVS